MRKTVYVDCPFCKGRLEVETESGKVVGQWAPMKREAGVDPFKQALDKMKAEKEKRQKYFEGAHSEMEERKKKAREKFDQEKERIEREKDFSRPESPFDLD